MLFKFRTVILGNVFTYKIYTELQDKKTPSVLDICTAWRKFAPKRYLLMSIQRLGWSIFLRCCWLLAVVFTIHNTNLCFREVYVQTVVITNILKFVKEQRHFVLISGKQHSVISKSKIRDFYSTNGYPSFAVDNQTDEEWYMILSCFLNSSSSSS